MNALLRNIAAHFVIGFMRMLGCVSTDFSFRILRETLPLYFLLRKNHVRKIEKRIQKSGFSLNISQYYQCRLKNYLYLVRDSGKATLPPGTVIQNEEYFIQCLTKPEPIVLFSLHLGPFEVLHKAPEKLSTQFKRPLFIVTAPGFAPVLTRKLASNRSGIGKTAVDNRSPFSGIRKCLRSRGIFSLMLDQMPGMSEEKLTLWNSITLPLNLKMIKFWKNKGARFLPISTWLENDHAVIRYEPCLSGLKGESLENLISKIRAFFEDRIATHPEQWNWSYPAIQI